jgi:hypothetical protein
MAMLRKSETERPLRFNNSRDWRDSKHKHGAKDRNKKY